MIPRNAAVRSFSKVMFPGYEKPLLDKQKRVLFTVAIMHVVDKWEPLEMFWACRKQTASL